MKQSRYIQVFEHEKIYTWENEDGRYLSPEQFDQLCAYNEKHKNKYFTVLRQGIKFSQYVGVIQVGRTTIEILPKTDRRNDTSLWRSVLLQMLAECRKIKREVVSEAILKKRENSFLDIYIEMYLDEVERLIRKGLIKQYRRYQKQTKALKGKLILATHLRDNVVHKERFYTEHTVYTEDNLFNQIIKAGLELVPKLNCSTYLKNRASGIEVFFYTISHTPRVTERTFEKLPDSRKTQSYQAALQLARLLLLNYSPDIKFGNENLLAILFNMNELWEEYIYRQLQKSKSDDTVVLYQKRQKFWEDKLIKPDIIVNKAGKTFVIDTKWKVLKQPLPADDDLKQIFAYNVYWDSYSSILLYPKTDYSLKSTYGKYHKGMPEEHGCTLVFINLFDLEGKFNKDCCAQIWEMLR